MNQDDYEKFWKEYSRIKGIRARNLEKLKDDRLFWHGMGEWTNEIFPNIVNLVKSCSSPEQLSRNIVDIFDFATEGPMCSISEFIERFKEKMPEQSIHGPSFRLSSFSNALVLERIKVLEIY
jgi:hypothetical protein